MSEISHEPFDLAKKFVGLHYPHCEAALLCGSAAEGNYSLHSDLDVLILDTDLAPTSLTSEIFESKKIDVVKVSTHKILDFIIKEMHARGAVGLRMLLTGHVIVDRNNLLSRIHLFARYYFFRGPSRLSMRYISPILFSIKNDLSGLLADKPFGEQVFIFERLITEQMKLLLDELGCWEALTKWRVKYLRNFSPTRCEKFEQAILQYWRKNDTAKIAEFTAKTLKRWWEPEKYNSLDFNPKVFVNHRSTTVFEIPSRSHYPLWIKEFFNPLKKDLGLPDYQYFFFFRNDLAWPGLEVVMVVHHQSHSELNRLTDQIHLRWVSLGWKSPVDDTPMKYRYTTGPFACARFGGLELAQSAEELFSFLCPKIITDGDDQDKSIGQALYLLIAFGKGMEFSKADFRVFVNFSFNYTLVLAVEQDLNLEIPSDFENIILNKFDLKFKADQEVIVRVFQLVLNEWENFEFEDRGLQNCIEQVKKFNSSLLSLEQKNLLKSYIPGYTLHAREQYALQAMELILNMLGLSQAEIPYTFYICNRLLKSDL